MRRSSFVFCLIIFVFKTAFSQNETVLNRGFYIAENVKAISFFNLNLLPSTTESNRIIKLQERQIFMTNDPNSQAIALLEDYFIKTTGDSIIRNFGFGVCVNPKTIVNPKLLRYNPGVRLVLFEPQKYQGIDDWDRVKKLIKGFGDNIPIKDTITLYWKIPPGDTTNSLKFPFTIRASSFRFVKKKLIPELIERFEFDKENCEIRKVIAQRFGQERAQNSYFISVYKNPIEIDKYKFLVVFRVW